MSESRIVRASGVQDGVMALACPMCAQAPPQGSGASPLAMVCTYGAIALASVV